MNIVIAYLQIIIVDEKVHRF